MTTFETPLINAIERLKEAMRIAPCEDTQECVEGAVQCLEVALKFVEQDREKESNAQENPETCT